MSSEFDHEQLEAITGGDREFEREVLEEYLATAPQDVQKLRAAIAAGDAPAAGAAAHALKGASATIGAKGFAALALELEHAGKQADLSRAPAILARMEHEFVALTELLRQHVARAA